MLSFQNLKEKIHKNYDIDFIERQKTQNLIIVFSPNKRYVLYKKNFKHDTLYICDKRLYHYLYNPGRQSKLLEEFIKSKNYTSVIFIGSSKGGAGALLWPSLMKSVSFKKISIVFSPLTDLFPYNKDIDFPAYINMIEKSKENPSLKKCLETYGSVYASANTSDHKKIVFYSKNYATDKVEAQKLETPYSFGIPLSFHGAINQFLVNHKDENEIKRLVDKLFDNAKDDNDLMSSLKSKDTLINEISSSPCPDIVDLVELLI